MYHGVDLGVLETYAFDWEPVYSDDGSDYLYTKVSLVVRAMVNGQAEVLNVQPDRPFNGPPISYAFAGGPQLTRAEKAVAIERSRVAPLNISADAFRPRPLNQPTNVKIPGQPLAGMNVSRDKGIFATERSTLRRIVRVANAAPLTHIAIRHRLTTPLGRLYVFSGPGQESGQPKPGSDDRVEPPAQLILESPQDPKWKTDCKNGPAPKLLGIYQTTQENTMLVDWQIETYVNESQLNDVKNTSALVSHRFSQSQVLLPDGHSIIATAGEAIFRSDFVYQLPETPDLKRPILFQPIPQGFVRSIDYVTARSDAIGVNYAYTDTQVASNFVAGVYVGAASITAVHRQAIVSNDSILEGALTTYERVLQLIANRRFADDARLRAEKRRGKT